MDQTQKNHKIKNKIRIVNINKQYGNKLVLKGIDMMVESGEAIGLLGPNGAGKTTCFQCIIGFINPDYGHVYLNDEEVTSYPIYKRAQKGISYLPQDSSVFKTLSVKGNIEAVLELYEKDKTKLKYKIDELIEELSLTHVANTTAMLLSGGERRRLEIARTLAINPLFILLDEPLAGVDPVSITEIINIINKLKSKNIGVIITDHNVRDALKIIDRAYLLYDGNVLVEGSPKSIVNHTKAKNVYLGTDFTM